MVSTLAQTKLYQLKCFSCGKLFDERETVTRCLSCGDPLTIEYDLKFMRQRLNVYALKNSPVSALKYLSFYPIQDLNKIVTLDEGGTPLLRCRNLSKKLGMNKLYIKNEGANPTGVFKDRGTLVEVTKALELNAKAVCLASTGNMAASVAAYSSIAKIPCYVLVPEGTPVGKLAQALSYGAHVIQVRGSYSDCATLAEALAKKYGFYLAGDYAFRLEGQKSQAYEIIEQLYWKCPDTVVCPVGCGTNLSAIWKGFKEFKELGLIDRLPRLIAAQSTGCNPVVKAFREKRSTFDIIEKPNTLCGAVAAGNPLDGKKILQALRESKGSAVEVTDEDALHAERELAKSEAVFVEPSGALGLAAISQLAKKGFFKKKDVVVCIATGSGLKDPKTILKIFPEPPSIEPDMREVDHYFKYKIYQIRSNGTPEKDKSMILLSGAVDPKRVKEVIRKEFNLTLDARLQRVITDEIRHFHEKGKALTRFDLQNILEGRLNELMMQEKVLQVTDFQTNTSKHREASAKVQMKYREQTIEAAGKGVGTVDAIITAIKRGIKEFDQLFVRLTDYNVKIYTGGVDATVKVDMTLEDKNGNRVVANATSPDVIVASVNAFEKGYNILYAKNYSK
ncbi:threonine synthase [Candidatus Peregrinibacteria bacterium]|nr:threonine synthase [Candidatus Peregrinibacteria bacterium]